MTTPPRPKGRGTGNARPPNHRWTRTPSGLLVRWTCRCCGLVVETSGSKPGDKSQRRWIGSRQLTKEESAPPCRYSGKVAPDRPAHNSVEVTRMLGECARLLGREWVDETLGRDEVVLTEGQQVALGQLYATMRFVLLDGADVLGAVLARFRALTRATLDANSEARGEWGGGETGRRAVARGVGV